MPQLWLHTRERWPSMDAFDMGRIWKAQAPGRTGPIGRPFSSYSCTGVHTTEKHRATLMCMTCSSSFISSTHVYTQTSIEINTPITQTQVIHTCARNIQIVYIDTHYMCTYTCLRILASLKAQIKELGLLVTLHAIPLLSEVSHLHVCVVRDDTIA